MKVKPIRTICGWCLKYGQLEPRVLVDVPEDGRGISHGICPSCAVKWRKGRKGETAA